MSKSNARTNSKTDAQQSTGAQPPTEAPPTWGGMPIDDTFRTTYVPAVFHDMVDSPESIEMLLSSGGVPGDLISKMRADGEAGAVNLNKMLMDPGFQANVAKRINAKPTDTQVSEDPKKGGKAGKPPAEKKPPVLPKPQSPAPQTEGVKSFMGISGAASKIGGQRGGPLKMVREEITPDGGRVTVTEYYQPGPGDTLSPVGREISDAAGNVVASEGTTDSSTAKAEDKPPKPPRKTVGEWASKENRPTIGERFEKNMEGFEKRGGTPNLANQAAIAAGTGAQHVVSGAAAMAARNWPAALATAAGLGAARYMLGSGTSAPANQPPAKLDPSEYLRLFGTPAQNAPAQPQANPAGTPPPDNTTLMQLQRLMRSREMA